MALDSGEKIVRRSWDVVPMPDAVITRANELGRDQPEQLVFADQRGRLMGDVQQIPGVDPVEIAGVEPDEANIADMPELDVELPGVDVETGEQQEIVPPQLSEDDKCDLDAPIGLEPENENEPVAVVTPPVEEPAVPTLRRSKRIFTKTKPGWEPSLKGNEHHCAMMQLEEQGVLYPDAHMFAQTDFYQSEPNVVAMIVTQLSLKAGLKRWGERAHKAAHSEMKQLHFRDTFRPKHWHELTSHQKLMVLESHMFLKEKRTKQIKGRTVAGGNKQRDYIQKEDASSPTVATESVLLTCTVDAEEGRDVAIVDMPNALMQTRVEDEKDMAIIDLRGVLVDILVEIAPDVCGPCVLVDKKGVK